MKAHKSKWIEELEQKFVQSERDTEHTIHLARTRQLMPEWRRAEKIAAGKPLVGKTLRVYHKFTIRPHFDTEDLILFSLPQQASLRLQYKVGGGGHLGGWEQTLKYSIPAPFPLDDGMVYRIEIKNKLPDDQPDLSVIDHEETRDTLKNVIKDINKKDLINIFTVQTERRYLDMPWKTREWEGGPVQKNIVEPAFDVGVIYAPYTTVKEEFRESEIEKKTGIARAVQEAKQEIFAVSQDPVLVGEEHYKLHRGVRFYLTNRPK